MSMPSEALNPTTERYVSLATFRRSGKEVRTPVWIVALGAISYVYSTDNAGKVKRLRNNPRARMAACNMRGGLLGEWVDVHGSFVLDKQLEQRVFSEFRRKYGFQITIANVLSRLAGRIDERVVMEFVPERHARSNGV
jgi:PPOX class probable F420-dependent enzyme